MTDDLSVNATFVVSGSISWRRRTTVASDYMIYQRGDGLHLPCSHFDAMNW